VHVLLLLQLEQWAAAMPCQVLALADAVMWTRAATGALQQLSAGNSRALRSLYEAATLRLETVSASLRVHSTLCQTSPDPAAATAVPAAAMQAAAGVAESATNDRPPTPDMSDSAPSLKPRGKQVSAGGVQLSGKARAAPGPNQKCTSSSGSAAGVSKIAGSAAHAASDPSQNVQQRLSQQQVLGLQALASAAACHRDVAAALVAAGADGITSFEWGKQLRHYWQPDTQELQVRQLAGCGMKHSCQRCARLFNTSCVCQSGSSAIGLTFRPVLSLVTAALAAVTRCPCYAAQSYWTARKLVFTAVGARV
jgi:hypothetical protein